jgi:asparagine synthase (glutamine-hydrolysing)
MRVIGGLRVSDSSRTVSVAEIATMAQRVGAVSVSVQAGQGPFGVFTSIVGDGLAFTNDVCVVADLELTNEAELQARVGGGRTHGALLAALYELDGPRFVRRLAGGFAIALWDRRRHCLLLAVDHFGIKRLHYASGPDGLAFASHAGLVAAHAAGTLEVSPSAVYEYLNFGFVPAPVTVFRNVKRLAPGHLLLERDGVVTVDPYWDLVYEERPQSAQAAATEMHQMVRAGVERTLRGMRTKEAGAFLSGGTDSSTVLGLASGVTGERVNAFSIGFDDAKYNELHYAEVAARHFGANHYTRIIRPDEALDAVLRIAQTYDEPFGNNSAIGTLFCATLARECGVYRLLAGDGGDEIFGGNERYVSDRVYALYHRIPAALRGRILEPMLARLPEGGASWLGRAQRYVQRARIPNPRRFYSWEFFFAQQGRDLLSPEFRERIDLDAPWTVAQSHWDRMPVRAELNRQLYLDMKLTIGDNDLFKVTRTAELAGVEVRFPLLDLPLVEFTGGLPARFKVRGWEKRPLFKQAFQSLLPAEILAKRKHGFGIPTSVWLRQPGRFRDFARDVLLSSRVRERGYFAPAALEQLLRLHDGETSPYYGDQLWRVLMLELWHQSHTDGTRRA